MEGPDRCAGSIVGGERLRQRPWEAHVGGVERGRNRLGWGLERTGGTFVGRPGGAGTVEELGWGEAWWSCVGFPCLRTGTPTVPTLLLLVLERTRPFVWGH